MSDAAPTPSKLWYRAADEFPSDALARRCRYIELMIEQGYIETEPEDLLGRDEQREVEDDLAQTARSVESSNQ